MANHTGVLFHYDNMKPVTYLTSYRILQECGWKVVSHQACSPHLASRDYHFGPNTFFFNLKVFNQGDQQKYHVTQALKKHQYSHEEGNMILPKKLHEKLIQESGT